MNARRREKPPFRRAKNGEAMPPRSSHFCEPELVCEVEFSEYTEDGGIFHPRFKGLVADANPRECVYPANASPESPKGRAARGETPRNQTAVENIEPAGHDMARPPAHRQAMNVHSNNPATAAPRSFKPSNLTKIF
jgi:hypothetical protein